MNRRDLEKMLGAVQEVLGGVENAVTQTPDDGMRTLLQSFNRALGQVTRPDPPRPAPATPPPPPRQPINVDAVIQRAMQQVHGRAPNPTELTQLRQVAQAVVNGGGDENLLTEVLQRTLQTWRPPAQQGGPQTPPRNYPPTPPSTVTTPPPPVATPSSSSSSADTVPIRRLTFHKDRP